MLSLLCGRDASIGLEHCPVGSVKHQLYHKLKVQVSPHPPPRLVATHETGAGTDSVARLARPRSPFLDFWGTLDGVDEASYYPGVGSPLSQDGRSPEPDQLVPSSGKRMRRS